MTRRLSPRQQQIAELVAAGVTKDADLAAVLGLSPRTIRCHVAGIMRKTDLHTRVEIAIHYSGPKRDRLDSYRPLPEPAPKGHRVGCFCSVCFIRSRPYRRPVRAA